MALTITERAAARIRKVFAEHHMPETAALRLGVKGGGCSGFSYTLDIAEAPAEDDELFEDSGVRLVTDPKSYLYLNGTEVDYNDDLLNGGFIFNNPNAKKSCGCGASFSA
ncbi:MAG: HesB/IscA family protein [Planctomycetota bacterium]